MIFWLILNVNSTINIIKKNSGNVPDIDCTKKPRDMLGILSPIT